MKYIFILLVIVGAGFYLNWAYVRIYASIGTNSIGNPTAHQIIQVAPSATTSVKKITYVALGDSLTAGVGASAENKTYAYQLAQILADAERADVTLVNLAWPGAAAADVLKNQAPLVGQFNPDVITVAIGTNDMHNRVPAHVFEQTISSIVDTLTTSSVHLNIINIPFIGSQSLFLPPYRTYFDWQIKRYNAFLHTALTNHQVNSIDLYSLTQAKAWADSSYYSTDGFHPSDSGYKFWSNALYDHLDF